MVRNKILRGQIQVVTGDFAGRAFERIKEELASSGKEVNLIYTSNIPDPVINQDKTGFEDYVRLYKNLGSLPLAPRARVISSVSGGAQVRNELAERYLGRDPTLVASSHTNEYKAYMSYQLINTMTEILEGEKPNLDFANFDRLYGVAMREILKLFGTQGIQDAPLKLQTEKFYDFLNSLHTTEKPLIFENADHFRWFLFLNHISEDEYDEFDFIFTVKRLGLSGAIKSPNEPSVWIEDQEVTDELGEVAKKAFRIRRDLTSEMEDSETGYDEYIVKTLRTALELSQAAKGASLGEEEKAEEILEALLYRTINSLTRYGFPNAIKQVEGLDDIDPNLTIQFNVPKSYSDSFFDSEDASEAAIGSVLGEVLGNALASPRTGEVNVSASVISFPDDKNKILLSIRNEETIAYDELYQKAHAGINEELLWFNPDKKQIEYAREVEFKQVFKERGYEQILSREEFDQRLEELKVLRNHKTAREELSFINGLSTKEYDLLKGGEGLGLVSTRKNISEMGGELEIISPDEFDGTTVHLIFPLAPVEGQSLGAKEIVEAVKKIYETELVTSEGKMVVNDDAKERVKELLFNLHKIRGREAREDFQKALKQKNASALWEFFDTTLPLEITGKHTWGAVPPYGEFEENRYNHITEIAKAPDKAAERDVILFPEELRPGGSFAINPEPFFNYYADLAQDEETAEILRLATILHDYGYLAAKDHYRVGADLAYDLLTKLGYDSHKAEIVKEIVHYHDRPFNFYMRPNREEAQGLFEDMSQVKAKVFGNETENFLKFLKMLTFFSMLDINFAGDRGLTDEFVPPLDDEDMSFSDLRKHPRFQQVNISELIKFPIIVQKKIEGRSLGEGSLVIYDNFISQNVVQDPFSVAVIDANLLSEETVLDGLIDRLNRNPNEIVQAMWNGEVLSEIEANKIRARIGSAVTENPERFQIIDMRSEINPEVGMKKMLEGRVMARLFNLARSLNPAIRTEQDLLKHIAVLASGETFEKMPKQHVKVIEYPKNQFPEGDELREMVDLKMVVLASQLAALQGDLEALHKQFPDTFRKDGELFKFTDALLDKLTELVQSFKAARERAIAA